MIFENKLAIIVSTEFKSSFRVARVIIPPWSLPFMAEDPD